MNIIIRRLIFVSNLCGFLFSLLSLILSFSQRAEARLPKESDLTSITEFETATYEVKRDGTYTLDYEVRVAVLSEGGRDNQAVKRVSFNARASKFELISAATINDGVEVKVAPSNVEIKEIGDAKAFDATKEAIISFPAVRVGSRVTFRYRLKVHEIPMVGFFSSGTNIDLQNVDSMRRTIRSELPLFVSVHDKMGLLDVKSRKEGSRFVVEIVNKDKLRFEVVQEDGAFVENGRLPSVIVSTQEKWSEFGKEVITMQEKLLSEPLPKALEAIRASAIKEPADRRMATVAGKIAQEFRYFGDWRRRNGGHIPRTLKEIVETGYGDCKDMSLVVVAIARAMGLKADVAWLWRGDVFPDESYYRLPNEFGFNHAVARVEDGVDGNESSVQWIDATNPVAIPGGVFADIGQRPALILSKSGVYLDRTPNLMSSDAVSKVELALSASGATFNLNGKLFQSGRSATHAEWALLYMPNEQFKYETARWLARNEKLESYDIDLPKESSRVVRNLTFPTRFAVADLGLRTTAGIGFPLFRIEVVDSLLFDTRDRFSDLWLGAPAVFEEEYLFPKASVVGNVKIGCDIRNEWVHLSRTVKTGPKGVEVKSRYEALKSVIPNAALKTTEYRFFQAKVRRCFNRSAVILSM